MTLPRLYVARDKKVTIVSRTPLRMPGCRPVRRPWTALAETVVADLHPDERRSLPDAALVVIPPIGAGVACTILGSVELALGVAGGVFFAMSYLMPMLRRRRAGNGTKVSPAATALVEKAEWRAFEQAVAIADRIAGTWPRLGALIDVAEAETMLAEALWEIADAQAHRQRLGAVLVRLSRPDLAARSATDETALELRNHLQATKAALADLKIDLSHRLANLRRAEEAGQAFIREDEMRSAIRAAEESLRSTRSSELSEAPPDPGAELAEHTRSVLDAYRELTAGLDRRPPA